MKRPPMNRRQFLRGVGGVAISLPLLDAMGGCSKPATGRASSALIGPNGNPQRFVSYFVPNGTLMDDWFRGSLDFGRILTPLAAHKADVTQITGMSYRAMFADSDYYCTHNIIPVIFSGYGLRGTAPENGTAGGITIDQVIADEVEKIAPMRLHTLPMGTQHSSMNTTIGWRGPNQPVPKFSQPIDVFQALFGDSTMDQEALRRQLARRQSILDRVKEDYSSVSKRVGGEDSKRLDAHLESIRAVERRLSVTAMCAPGDPSYPQYQLYPADAVDLDLKVRAFIDLTVLAMTCDATRVATLCPSPCGGGSRYYNFLGLPGEENYAGGEGHELSHAAPSDPTAREKMIRICTWYTEMLAYMVQKMKDVSEVSGSLFDNVLILQASEVSDGAAHSVDNIPFLLVGSGGGAFRTGQYLTYPSTAHNNLLLTILNGFGIPRTTFGAPALSTGKLAGLLA